MSSFSGRESAYSQEADVSWASAIGTIVSAFSFAGHTYAQLPQPVQSSSEICIVKYIPEACLPKALTAFIPSGMPAFSSSVRRYGRTTACGQTYAQRLHWMHLSAFQTGTRVAMPRFSNAVRPISMTPSLYRIRRLIGRSSPFCSLIGSRISVTYSGTFLGAFGASCASFQSSGISTST